MEYVYLDLNMWIDLHQRDEDNAIRLQIEEAVENKKIAIPLTDTLLQEEAKYADEEIRADLFEYIRELSNLYTLRNYFGIQSFEIERFVYGMRGNPNYDLESQVRGRGIDHMFGNWTLTIDGVDVIENNLVEDDVINKIERLIKSRPGFDIATQASIERLQKEGDEWEKELQKEVETITEEWDEKFDDNKRRRRYAHLYHFMKQVAPELVGEFFTKGQYFDFSMYDFKRYVNEDNEEVDTLFRLFPSNYTHTTLTNARDLQDGGKPNDIYDIFSLAVAIPYCDVVATETFWKTTAFRANLNREYGTEIIDSLNKLPEAVESI